MFDSFPTEAWTEGCNFKWSFSSLFWINVSNSSLKKISVSNAVVLRSIVAAKTLNHHQLTPLEPSTQINHSTRLHLISAMLTGLHADHSTLGMVFYSNWSDSDTYSVISKLCEGNIMQDDLFCLEAQACTKYLRYHIASVNKSCHNSLVQHL